MTARERILRLLRAYHPLPLTYEDLADELNLMRSTLHTVVGQMVKAGDVKRETVFDGGDTITHLWLESAPAAEAAP